MNRLLSIVLAATLLGLAIPVPGWAQDTAAEKELRTAFDKGRALVEQGKYTEALPYYQKALELAPTVFGRDHTNTAVILNNLAILYSDMGQHAKAELLHQRSLEIREAKLGKDHPDVASTLSALAFLYSEIGQY